MDRRSILRSAGALTVIGLPTTATAATSQEQNGQFENLPGVTKAIQKLVRQQKLEKAEDLAEKHDVPFTYKSASIDHGSTEDELSTEDRYSESESNIYIAMHQTGSPDSCSSTNDDVWRVYGWANLETARTRFRHASASPDFCSITYDSTEWTSCDATEDNVVLDYWSTESMDQTGGIDYYEYDANTGVIAEANIPGNITSDGLSHYWLETELTRNAGTGNDDIPVYFNYEHTYAPFPDIGWVDVSISAGVLDVSITGANQAWDDKVSTRPSG